MLKYLLAFSLLVNFAHAQKKDFTDAEAKILKTDALRLFEKRDDQSSLEESLSKFEKVHESNPQDLEILTYLARGYFILADLHVTNDDLKMRYFEKARAYGKKGLELNPDYKKLEDSNIEKAIDKLTSKEVPILFWYAAALGKWAKLNGVFKSLSYKNEIITSVKRVEKLDPKFNHAAVPRYWGGFYAVAPSIAGGDMKKSKKYFMEAMKEAPEYLGTKRLYAELYLVKEEDKKEFKKQLEEVLKAPNGPADLVPDNILEKRQAERLLDKIDDLF